MKCWDRKTTLETALLLILCISIPFFIAMIITYIVFLVQDNAAKTVDCNKFCEDHVIEVLLEVLCISIPFLIAMIFTYIYFMYSEHTSIHCKKFCEENIIEVEVAGNETNQDLKSKIVNQRPERLKSGSSPIVVIKDRIENDERDLEIEDLNATTTTFPYLASISQNYYVDEDYSKEYLCSGAVLTPTYVLTGGPCVRREGRDYEDVEGVFVRVGSDYWSRGGFVQSAKRIIFASDGKLAAIIVETPFPVDDVIRALKLKKYPLNFKWMNVAMVGWKTSEDLPLRHRMKYVLPTRTGLTECEAEEDVGYNVICSEETRPSQYCTNDMGSLLTDSEFLYGVQVEEVCFKEFKVCHLYESTEKYLNWIQTFAIGVVVV